MDQSVVQVIVAYVASFVLEWLKKVPWFPVISEQSTKIWKVIVSAVIAACSALAITYAWEPATGTLTLTGLTLSNIGNGLLAFLLSFIAQHIAYEKVIRAPR